MTELRFERSVRYTFDNAIRIPVRVHRSGLRPFLVSAVVDTGASMSIFSVDVLERAGVQDPATGEEVRFRLADDRPVRAYVHTLSLTVLGLPIHVPVLASPELPREIDNLLGVMGVFDQIDFAILHRERRLYVRA
jgi:hypothetical protein